MHTHAHTLKHHAASHACTRMRARTQAHGHTSTPTPSTHPRAHAQTCSIALCSHTDDRQRLTRAHASTSHTILHVCTHARTCASPNAQMHSHTSANTNTHAFVFQRVQASVACVGRERRCTRPRRAGAAHGLQKDGHASKAKGEQGAGGEGTARRHASRRGKADDPRAAQNAITAGCR